MAAARASAAWIAASPLPGWGVVGSVMGQRWSEYSRYTTYTANQVITRQAATSRPVKKISTTTQHNGRGDGTPAPPPRP
ncbi:hypothetical protein GCM10010452_10410 [Crossiella cryophila]